MMKLLGALLAVIATLAVPAAAEAAQTAVFTESNAVSGNHVVIFSKAADGHLVRRGAVRTRGFGTGANLGSEGAVAFNPTAGALFVVNAGSNSVSAFTVDGRTLKLQSVRWSHGRDPISVTTRGGLVYVLNGGARPTISGFRWSGSELIPMDRSTRGLPAVDVGPAQIAFSPSGAFLVVTNKTSNTIDTFAVHHGRAGAPVSSPSAGTTPFGFAFTKLGTLVVSDAGGDPSSAASSYRLNRDGSLHTVTAQAFTHQQAACWVAATPDGRFAYVANAGSGSISGYRVFSGGSLQLLDASGVTADTGLGSHPLDEAISSNGATLYDLTDGFHSISAFRIGRHGALRALGAVGGLPAGAVGLATS